MLSVAATLLTMSCSSESSLFQRENDVVTCDCSEPIISPSIKCDGQTMFHQDYTLNKLSIKHQN